MKRITEDRKGDDIPSYYINQTNSTVKEKTEYSEPKASSEDNTYDTPKQSARSLNYESQDVFPLENNKSSSETIQESNETE